MPRLVGTRHDKVIDDKLRILQENLSKHPYISVTYFVKDMKKDGGSYHTIDGNLKRIDEYEHVLILMDGVKIPIRDIADIESDILPDYEIRQ